MLFYALVLTIFFPVFAAANQNNPIEIAKTLNLTQQITAALQKPKQKKQDGKERKINPDGYCRKIDIDLMEGFVRMYNKPEYKSEFEYEHRNGNAKKSSTLPSLYSKILIPVSPKFSWGLSAEFFVIPVNFYIFSNIYSKVSKIFQN